MEGGFFSGQLLIAMPGISDPRFERALILVCAFGIFVATGLPAIKEIGLGAAVAIAIDATLIRLVLVPAAMALFGAWSWWLPAPLARMLPVRAPTPSSDASAA